MNSLDAFQGNFKTVKSFMLDSAAGEANISCGNPLKMRAPGAEKNVSILQWVFLGALLLGLILFCARIMRKGIRTLDDDRKRWLERMHTEELRIEEDRKNIAAADHLVMMRAAVDDLLRLEGRTQGYETRSEGRRIELATPNGPWLVELLMREKNLRSAHRVLHGRSRWLLSGFGVHEQHADPASLMRSLACHLRGEDNPLFEPEHLARRLARAPGKAR